MDAVDRYPAALFELSAIVQEANDLAMAAHALEDRVSKLIADLGLLPPDFETEAEEAAYWDPFYEELERRENEAKG
jgi:hypothetical protein